VIESVVRVDPLGVSSIKNNGVVQVTFHSPNALKYVVAHVLVAVQLHTPNVGTGE